MHAPARGLHLAAANMALHLHIDRGQKETALHFSTFPVRIGRGAEAECRLEFAYVSRLHARIDLIDGRLLLQDEGSRSGTWVHDHSRRLQRGARVDLATIGNEFHVGPDLRVRVELDEQTIEQQQQQKQRDGAAPSATVDAGMVPTTCYQDSHVDPQALDARAVELQVLGALADHRRAAEYLESVLTQASACAPEHVKRLAELVVELDPEWDGRAALRHFVTLSGVRPRPSRVDTTALAVLQEIASTYVPYAPALGSTEAVTEFAGRLDTVLSLLIEGIAAMRYAVEREAGAMSAASPARKDLGACLLDWTNDGAYVRRLHEEIRFMLGHHRRLVDEVTERFGRILEHLSPEAIESEPQCRRAGWRTRHKAAWAELRRRHEALVRVRERALGPVFGKVARALKGTGAEQLALT